MIRTPRTRHVDGDAKEQRPDAARASDDAEVYSAWYVHTIPFTCVYSSVQLTPISQLDKITLIHFECGRCIWWQPSCYHSYYVAENRCVSWTMGSLVVGLCLSLILFPAFPRRSQGLLRPIPARYDAGFHLPTRPPITFRCSGSDFWRMQEMTTSESTRQRATSRRNGWWY